MTKISNNLHNRSNQHQPEMMIITALAFLFVCEGVQIFQNADGITAFQDGIVVTDFKVQTYVFIIELSNAEHLPTLVDQLKLDARMKDLAKHHLKLIGERLDNHLKTVLETWHQDSSHKELTIQEIKLYWDESTIRPKRVKRFEPVSAIMIIGVSLVGGLSIYNTVKLTMVEKQVDSQMKDIAVLQEFVKETTLSLAKLEKAINVNSKYFEEEVFPKLKILQDEQEDQLNLLLLLHDAGIALTVFHSVVLSELDKLKDGRFPVHLIEKSSLEMLSNLTTNEEMSFPLRLLMSRVLEVNVQNLTLTIEVEVPLMKILTYWMKYRVENVGVQDGNCTKFYSAPNFVALVNSTFQEINHELCMSPTSKFMKCRAGAFGSSNCYPTTKNCNFTLNCNDQRPFVISTPNGYLVNMKNEFLVRQNGVLKEQVTDQGTSYMVVLDKDETLEVDSIMVVRDSRDKITSTVAIYFHAQTFENEKFNFSKNIKELKDVQKEMRDSIANLENHPIMTGSTIRWLKSEMWSVIGVLVGVIVFGIVIICLRIWMNKRARAARQDEAQFRVPAHP